MSHRKIEQRWQLLIEGPPHHPAVRKMSSAASGAGAAAPSSPLSVRIPLQRGEPIGRAAPPSSPVLISACQEELRALLAPIAARTAPGILSSALNNIAYDLSAGRGIQGSDEPGIPALMFRHFDEQGPAPAAAAGEQRVAAPSVRTRPAGGWLHSSADPSVGVCDGCGEFTSESELATLGGHCSEACRTGVVPLPPPSPTLAGAAAPPMESSPPRNGYRDMIFRGGPPLRRQTSRSPAIEAEQADALCEHWWPRNAPQPCAACDRPPAGSSAASAGGAAGPHHWLDFPHFTG